MPVDPVVRLKLRVPLTDGKSLALIHALGRVVNSVAGESEMRLDAELPESLARRDGAICGVAPAKRAR